MDLVTVLRIWDLASGQQRVAFAGHTGPVRAVAIAPDGACLGGARQNGPVRIWHPAASGICALMRVDSPLHDCTWNPSGQSLVVAGGAGLNHFTFRP